MLQISVTPQSQGATPKQRSTSLPLGVIPLPPGSRGPRSLYLRRQENGFGFTLRHFIVYPPEPIEVSSMFFCSNPVTRFYLPQCDNTRLFCYSKAKFLIFVLLLLLFRHNTQIRLILIKYEWMSPTIFEQYGFCSPNLKKLKKISFRLRNTK